MKRAWVLILFFGMTASAQGRWQGPQQNAVAIRLLAGGLFMIPLVTPIPKGTILLSLSEIAGVRVRCVSDGVAAYECKKRP